MEVEGTRLYFCNFYVFLSTIFIFKLFKRQGRVLTTSKYMSTIFRNLLCVRLYAWGGAEEGFQCNRGMRE